MAALSDAAAPAIRFSPSAMDTFRGCPARFWLERHPDAGSGVLPVDDTAALLGSALHAALMAYQRRLAQPGLAGDDALAVLRSLVRRALFGHHLEPSLPAVAERLRRAAPGLRRLALELPAEQPVWAEEGGHPLVWVEPWLDHGPGQPAVELAPGVIAATRPDVIGLRRQTNGRLRVVVRDYKVRGHLVEPLWDWGILVRAIWALLEGNRPRCRWFLAGRDRAVAGDAVEVETVNVLFGQDERFVVRQQLTAGLLAARRTEALALLAEMATVEGTTALADVPASPGELCQRWCGVLHRCPAGQAHVRQYAGPEVLAARLADVPSMVANRG